MPHSSRDSRRWQNAGRLAMRYWSDTSGNILPLIAIMTPLLLLALGAATDYTSAGRRYETIQGVSDAAVLAATQPIMMQQSCATETSSTCLIVRQQVVDIFNAQAAGVQGVTPTTITTANVTISDSAAPVQRTATVNWTAQSKNTFAGILGVSTFQISGTSIAKNSSSPVTTFYMLIDESSSMYFPSTTTDATTMVTATPANMGHPASSGGPSGGCAFGCHEGSNAGSSFDNLYNPSNITCQAPPAGVTTPFTTGSTYFGCVTNTGSSWAANGTASPTILPVGLTRYPATGTATYTCAALTSANSKNTATQATNSSSNPWAPTSASGFTHAYGAEDNFALSRCLGVSLRIDLVNDALKDLLSAGTYTVWTNCATVGIAQCTAIENNTTFAFDIYTLDLGDTPLANTYTLGSGVTAPGTVSPSAGQAGIGLENIYNWGASSGYTANSLPGSTGAPAGIAANTIASSGMTYLADAKAAFANVSPMESWGNGCTTSSCGSGGDPDSPIDTDGIDGLLGIMPAPGKGTSASNDSPEEVLFIVSDGLNDVAKVTGTYPTSSPCAAGTDPQDKSYTNSGGTESYYNDYGRPLFCVGQIPTVSNSYCTQVKAKGIRIAFLYMRYVALDPDPDYIDNVEPWQYPGGEGGEDNIEQGAIACATPGLEFTVDSTTDITSAMADLFQKAVQTAYLAH